MSSDPRSRNVWSALALIGLLGGFFSGLFGVGGGIILVPLLVLLVGFGQKRASGTSLAAILPTSIAGSISYAASGSIDWVAGACLGGGAIIGSLVGTWLLDRLRQRLLRWLFIVFLLLTAARLFFLIPDRGHMLDITVPLVLVLVGVGVLVGLLSGLLGVGGGVVVVPVLMIVFGVGDLVAKGTSLLMMIPTALTGTIANVRRGHVDLPAGLMVGALAVGSSVGGAALATILPAQLGAVLFALLLVASAVQLTVHTLRNR